MKREKKPPLEAIKKRLEEITTNIDSLQRQIIDTSSGATTKEDLDQLATMTLQNLSIVRKHGLEEILQAAKALDAPLQEARVGRLAKRMAEMYFRCTSAEEFLNSVVDDLMQETGSERAAIVLTGKASGEAQVVTIRNFKSRELEAAEHTLSRTLLRKVFDSGESFLLPDASADPDLWRESSIYMRLGCALVAPMKIEDLLLGAIYLENNSATCVYDEVDRKLLEDVSELIAVYLEATNRLDRAIQARDEALQQAHGESRFPEIVGSSSKLLRVLQIVEQVADTNATVLIEGESGTGKELIARAIHRRSSRAEKPLIILNCAAVPDTLVESELFGHEKGAFTGAHERKTGRFERADGGSIFLDEIGELALQVQGKLLRVLQVQEFERLGSTKTLKVDVRVIAATSRDLKQMVEGGAFLEALYYRLNVIPVRLPALRERRDDIPLLANFFLKKFLADSEAKVRFDSETLQRLEDYEFPGNIRELENLVQRLVLLRSGEVITVNDLPDYIAGERHRIIDLEKNPFRHYMQSVPDGNEDLQRRRATILRIAQDHVDELENQMIEQYLQQTGGNVAEASRLSGLHRSMFYRKRRQPHSSGESQD